MDLEKSLNIIIEQERKEIKSYNSFALMVIIAFLLLLCFNLISGYIKDIAAALTNFLTLAAGYIPFQQIVKRRRRINFFDKIVRIGITEDNSNKETYINIIIDTIKEAIKN
ncbi:MAG: hypothetical protein WKG06_06045 [Segetibacter sp.]